MRLLTSRERDDDDVGRALVRSLDVIHADLRRLDGSLGRSVEVAVKDVLELVMERMDRRAGEINARLEALETVVAACAEGEHPAESDRWISVAEAVQIANVREETVRRWVREGKIASTRLPSRRLQLRYLDVRRVVEGGPPEAAMGVSP
jgi:hypothetical protein